MRLTVLSHSCIVPTNQRFYAALAAQGVHLQLIVPALWREDIQGAVRPAVRDPGLEALWQPVQVWNSGSVPLHTYRTDLRRAFYLFQPDAIYCENESYAASTIQTAIANRSSVRRPMLCRNNQNLVKRHPWPFRLAERWLLRDMACVNLVNEEAGQRLREKGYRGRLAYMPYGVDLDRYYPRETGSLRAEWGSPAFVFGYLGRLIEEKGLRVLVEAFQRFHPEEDVALVIVGDGPMRESLCVMLEHPGLRGRVRWVPAVPHAAAPELLSAFDALVLPSLTRPGWKEQFGRVLIEAAACGTPVIGSDSGEIPHLIDRLGHGLTVREGQVDALYLAMRRLREETELRDALREQGRREVAQQFDVEALAYRFKQLLDSLVATPLPGLSEAG